MYIAIKRRNSNQNTHDANSAELTVDLNILTVSSADSGVQSPKAKLVGNITGTLYKTDESGTGNCAIVGVAGRKSGQILVIKTTTIPADTYPLVAPYLSAMCKQIYGITPDKIIDAKAYVRPQWAPYAVRSQIEW